MNLEDVKRHTEYMRNVVKESEKKELESRGLKDKNRLSPIPQYDSVYSLNNSEATILYIIGMILASLFKDGYLLWIAFTFIWLRYITRHL